MKFSKNDKLFLFGHELKVSRVWGMAVKSIRATCEPHCCHGPNVLELTISSKELEKQIKEGTIWYEGKPTSTNTSKKDIPVKKVRAAAPKRSKME